MTPNSRGFGGVGRAAASTGLGLTPRFGAAAPASGQKDDAEPVSPSSRERDHFLDEDTRTMSSLRKANRSQRFATLPLSDGSFESETVSSVITDVYSAALAENLGMIFAARPTNSTDGCPAARRRSRPQRVSSASTTSPTRGRSISRPSGSWFRARPVSRPNRPSPARSPTRTAARASRSKAPPSSPTLRSSQPRLPLQRDRPCRHPRPVDGHRPRGVDRGPPFDPCLLSP